MAARHTRLLLAALTVASWAWSPSASGALPHYIAIDLTGRDQSSVATEAMAINNLGEVVLDGVRINNKGLIVGSSFDFTDIYQPVQTRYSVMVGTKEGYTENLGKGIPTGISDTGAVVGYSFPEDWVHVRATIWKDGQVTHLPGLTTVEGLTSNSQAYAINNVDHVVGYSVLKGAVDHAVMWREGELIDLGADNPYADSHAYDVNDRDQVAGDMDGWATVWSDGQALNLGVRGRVTGINNLGQAIGFYQEPYNSDTLFIWTAETGVVSLYGLLGTNDEGWLTGYPERLNDINDAGQIVGLGEFRYGLGNAWHAMLLTPVPEPSTWMFFMLGLCGMGLVRLSRSH
jgi:probable HAF family extracellular repeat protein